MLTAGCAVGGSQATIGPGDSPPIDLPHAGRALVANSLGETLSDLDFAQTPAALRNDLAPTGQSPNDLLVAGDRLLVVNSLSNSLQVCRLNTLETTAEISTGPRSNPWNVEAVGGLAYVTCWASAEVIAIDLGTNAVLDRLLVPGADRLPHDEGTNTRPFPQGVAATASGDRLFVTLANLDPNFAAGGPGVVLVVDSDRGALVEHAVLVLPTGRNAGDVAWAQVGGRESMAVACAGDFEAGTGYLQNGSFHLLDVTTLREVAAIPVPSAPVEVLVVGERAFGAGAQIGDISQVDLGERTAGPIIDIPDSGVGLNYCSGLAPLDAAHLLAAEFNGDRLYVVDLARNAVTGSWTVGDGPDAVVVIPE